MKYEYLSIIAPFVIVALFMCIASGLILLLNAGYFLFGTAVDILLLLAMIGLMVGTFVGWVKASIVSQGRGLDSETSQREARAIELAVKYVCDNAWPYIEAYHKHAETRWIEESKQLAWVVVLNTKPQSSSQDMQIVVRVDWEGREVISSSLDSFLAKEGVMSRSEAIGTAKQYVENKGWTCDDALYTNAELRLGGIGRSWGWVWSVYLNIGSTTPVIWVSMNAKTGDLMRILKTE